MNDWPRVKIAKSNSDGFKAILAFYDHFGGTNNVDHLLKQAEMEFQSLT